MAPSAVSLRASGLQDFDVRGLSMPASCLVVLQTWIDCFSVATSMYHIRYMCRFAVDELAMSLMPFSSLICPRSHFQDMLHQSDIRKLKQNSKP